MDRLLEFTIAEKGVASCYKLGGEVVARSKEWKTGPRVALAVLALHSAAWVKGGCVGSPPRLQRPVGEGLADAEKIDRYAHKNLDLSFEIAYFICA